MRTIEDIARDDIRIYMTPHPTLGFNGFSQEIAVRKAMAAHWTRKDVIERIGKTEILKPFSKE